MKTILSAGFCLLLGLSLIAGCGGGGSAIQTFTTPPPRVSPSPCPSGLACLSLVATPPPQTGNVGQAFSFYPLDYVQGGLPPYTVSIKSGMLPAGLTLHSQDVLAGIPTATAVATAINFTVTDSETPPVSVDVPLSLTINPMLPLTISPASGALPNGTVGELYGHRICIDNRAKGFTRFGTCFFVPGFYVKGSGGMQGSAVPYIFSWSAAPGSSLVPGLSITTSGSGGFISGTPTRTGIYNFVVTVTDFESPPKQVSANYTITVAPAPSPSPSPSPSASP